MTRLAAFSLLALILAEISGCASEAPSGATASKPRNDRLDPVNAFPQVRDSYMRQ